MTPDNKERAMIAAGFTTMLFMVLGTGFFIAGDAWRVVVLSNIGVGLWIAAGVAFVAFLFGVLYLVLEDE